MDLDDSNEEFLVNLLTLPTELLVYIISFLSSILDRLNMRYVSSWLRCVIEGTPSLWKEFIWPYYDHYQECKMKNFKVLKVCGRHIKVLSFPKSRVPLTLVEMLQYCSNVQHLSLPSAKLNPGQLRIMMNHMTHLEILEIKVDEEGDVKQLLNAEQIKHLKIISSICHLKELFNHWTKSKSRPSNVTFNVPVITDHLDLIDYIARLYPIQTTITTSFRVYHGMNNFPHLQLQLEAGQISTPGVKLSDVGILGLNNDVAVMTDCQYGGRAMCMVRYQFDDDIANKLNSLPITRCDDLSCVTHFDLANCHSLYSGHLEQLAIACPNLQRLNLQHCCYCLINLQGLQAIASHCHNLQGLNLLGISILNVQDHYLL